VSSFYTVPKLINHQATKYDRATAGTTLIIHVKGTTVPGMPLVPERLKAQVYFPPHFLVEHLEVELTLAFLVQTVVEHISIPTANDWRWKAQRMWSLTQCRHIGPVILPMANVLHPINTKSAQYLFSGRPWNHFVLPAPTVTPALPGATPVHHDNLALFDIDVLAMEEDAIAQIVELEVENQQLRATIETLQVLNASMQSDFTDREHNTSTELEIMMTKVVRLEAELRAMRGASLSVAV
jgi:hypothetical protein